MDLEQWVQSVVGKVIAGKYKVVRALGVGGFGGVFLCEHEMLGGRLFALKLIVPNPHAGSLEEQERRLAREAATALSFVHPRAVQVREFGADHENDVIYMAMDYVEGTSLAQELEESSALHKEGATPIEQGRALRIILMILDVLEAAHAAGVIHRDLKPGNILLVGEKDHEDIKVLDFGLAKVIDAAVGAPEGISKPSSDSVLVSGPITQPGAVLGTPQYMAPEQARGKGEDHRADLYSLGVILYEMLTGKLPHGATNVHELLFQRATEPPISIEEARPDIEFSAPLRVILDYALDPEPDNRLEDASAFAGAVEEALDELGAEKPKHDTQAVRILARHDTRITRVVPGPVRGLGGGLTAAFAAWLRSHALAGAGVAAGVAITLTVLVYAGMSIRDAVQYARLMREGEAALEEGRAGDALEAFVGAGRIKPTDRRPADAVHRAFQLIDRQAVTSGDMVRLRRDIDRARRLGRPFEETEAPEKLLAAGLKLEEVDRLLKQKRYVRADVSLASVEPAVPEAWSERVVRQRQAIDRAFLSAERLLGESARLARENELERAAALLSEFLKSFPSHPSCEEAWARRARLFAELGGKDEGTAATGSGRTGLRIVSRPQGLVCHVDGRKVGITPRDMVGGLEPGSHELTLVDSEGFVSRHTIVAEANAVTRFDLDHAEAVAAEREAYSKVVAAWPGSPERAIEAAGQYLEVFKKGSKRDDVLQIVKAARGRLAAEARKRAERDALIKLGDLRRQEENPEAKLRAASAFLKEFPDSGRAEEVRRWEKEWRERHLLREEARETRESVLALLQREDVAPEARAEAVRGYVDRYGCAEDRNVVRGVVERLLRRPLTEGGPVLLASSMGTGRVALVAAEPPVVSAHALASGRRLASASLPDYEPRSLASDPSGNAVFVGTKSGSVLRWNPQTQSTGGSARPTRPAEILRLDGPVQVLLALSAERVFASAGSRKGSGLFSADETGRFVPERLPGARRGILCAVRNAEGSRFVLGDQKGNATVFSVSDEGDVSVYWSVRVRGPVSAAAISADSGILAVCTELEGEARTVLWSIGGKPQTAVAEYPVGSDRIEFLDDSGRLLVGDLVVGPGPGCVAIPLRIGSAWAVDPGRCYLVATDTEGHAAVYYLTELLRQIDLGAKRRRAE